jgi:hypothetical protein
MDGSRLALHNMRAVGLARRDDGENLGGLSLSAERARVYQMKQISRRYGRSQSSIHNKYVFNANHAPARDNNAASLFGNAGFSAAASAHYLKVKHALCAGATRRGVQNVQSHSLDRLLCKAACN